MKYGSNTIKKRVLKIVMTRYSIGFNELSKDKEKHVILINFLCPIFINIFFIFKTILLITNSNKLTAGFVILNIDNFPLRLSSVILNKSGHIYC